MGVGGGVASGATGWAQALVLESGGGVMPAFLVLAQTSHLPVQFNVRNQTSPHQKQNVAPVCSGEVWGNVWWGGWKGH